MGLDMYLKAKSETFKRQAKTLTGACGGLFPIAPKANGYREMGYWRKAYDLQDEIMGIVRQNLGVENLDEDNCVDFKLTKENLEDLVRWSMDNDDSYSGDIFKKTLKLIKTDPKAEIVYYQWY